VFRKAMRLLKEHDWTDWTVFLIIVMTLVFATYLTILLMNQ
jgi:hypothetical protein